MTNDIILNDEQQNVYNNLIKFLQSDENELLLIGYAGTGKTTLITKFINDIINQKMVRRIALAAPTHKAVGIIKNKLFGNLSGATNNTNNTNITKYMDILTIHRLLNYQNYIDNDGNNYFAKSLVDTNWDIYDVIVIDECSMLNNQIINDILIEIEKNQNKKKLKIIYVGDPVQLPPVNQKISKIFNREIKKCYLEKIIRTNNNSIMDLSNHHRKWILSGNDNDIPKLELYESDTIIIHENKNVNLWLEHFIDKSKDNNNKDNNIILTWTNKKCNLYNDYVRKKIFNKENLSKYEIGEILIFQDYHRKKINESNNFIIFYTSEQVKLCDLKESVYKFEKIKSLKNNLLPEELSKLFSKYIKKLNNIIVDDIKTYELMVKKINDDNFNLFTESFSKLKKKIEIYNFKLKKKDILIADKLKIVELIDKNITFINTLIHKYYESLCQTNIYLNKDELIKIYSIHTDDEIKYNNIIELGNKILIRLKEKLHKKINNLKNIDNIKKCDIFSIVEKKINNLWKDWQMNVIDIFAQLNYGYCITVHKSQGSTFKNVFIDIFDIFENKSKEEVLKCLYTAITRTSDSLELLV
jgi:hypothetical protein